MLEINTRDFGIIKVDDDAIFDFPDGIYGFEEVTKFAVFKNNIDDVSFLYLQSVQNPSPCFLVFEPWDLYANYKPEPSREDLTACEADSIDDLIFLTIANIPSSIHELSINIKSPIVLNPKTRKGKQIILQNSDYTVKYKPFLQSRKAGI